MTGALAVCSLLIICAAPVQLSTPRFCECRGMVSHLQDDHLLSVAYSFDGGLSWTNYTGGSGPASFPGVVCPRDIFVPYIVWQQEDDVWFTYDQFFPFMVFTPVLIDTGVAMPSIATTPLGDTILISAGDIDDPGATNNAYLYRSFDGGLTWVPKVMMIDTQGNPGYEGIDCPRLAMGEGGYVFALFDWVPTGSERAIPHYTESMDYGATWSQPDMVFPSWPPYPDATCGRGYGYDVVLDPQDNYRPHCAIRLACMNYEFGDVWECHPTSGGPGNWTGWVYRLLLGDGMGGPYATEPTIGRGSSGGLFVTLRALFFPPSLDIGVCTSTDQGATWTAPDPITHDTVRETGIELADNVSDSLHVVYVNDYDNPSSVWHVASPYYGYGRLDSIGPTQSNCILGTPGKNIYAGFDGDTLAVVYTGPRVVGVEEALKSQLPITNDQLLQNYPNPFSRTTLIELKVKSEKSKVLLKVYDLAGRLIRTLVDDSQSVTGYESPVAVRWDGRDGLGRPVGSGVYFYRLSVSGQGGEFVSTKKMMLLR